MKTMKVMVSMAIWQQRSVTIAYQWRKAEKAIFSIGASAIRRRK